MNKHKNVFVTVGTTKFEGLVKAVTEERFQKLLLSQGYTDLVIQLGHGEYVPDTNVDGLKVEWYRFKPSLTQDMTGASLIISHGGSGCIQESLSLEKPLVVVVNETLMNNHQWELARQLAKDNHLVCTTCQSLYDTMEKLDITLLVKYKPGDPKLFGKYLDDLIGFN